MKRILLTGGTGYIGSHTCIELLKNNYKITILDSLINSKYETYERIIKILEKQSPLVKNNVELCVGDIRNLEFLEKLFGSKKSDSLGFDGVIHCCGLNC